VIQLKRRFFASTISPPERRSSPPERRRRPMERSGLDPASARPWPRRGGGLRWN